MESERELRRRNAQEQLTHDRYIRRMEKRAVRKKKQQLTSWILEFSKKVVVLCVVLHAAVFIFSAVMIWRTFDTTALSTIITESSEVMRSCVFGYMIKAGIENWQKIRNGKQDTAAQETQQNEEMEGMG